MRTISSVGLSQKDENVLKALLDLLGARTREAWRYAPAGTTDAVILDTDNRDALAQWLAHGHDRTLTPIAYASAPIDLPVEHRLTKPFRAADLIAVLNTISSRDTGPESAETAEPREDAEADIPVLSGAIPPLAQQVAECRTRYLRLSSARQTVLLDCANKRFAMKHPELPLREFLRTAPDQLDVVACDQPGAGFEGIDSWQSDTPLRWWIGVECSSARLLRSLDSSSRFKILRWPEPGLIKHSQHYLSLSALLSRKSGVTLAEIASASSIAADVVTGFINAASLTGILTTRTVKNEPGAVLAPPAADPAPAAPVNKGLFARIRARLTL